MIVLALIAFVIGVACAFKANLLIFGIVAFALTVVFSFVASQFDFGVGASLAALMTAIVVQVGYAAGVWIRSVIVPFSDVRGDRRGRGDPCASHRRSTLRLVRKGMAGFGPSI
jgi:hypothetical protein